MELIISENLKIYYKTYGDNKGVPLVLIHGLGADHLMWKPQIKKYTSKGFYLIVPDLRGHGKSCAVDVFTIEDCADDIALILDKLGIKRAVLVGVSLGGIIAQQFAYDYANRVSKLIICDSFCHTKTIARQFNGWLQWITLKISPTIISKTLHLAYKGEEKQVALSTLEIVFVK